jgi:hypothetical protein
MPRPGVLTSALALSLFLATTALHADEKTERRPAVLPTPVNLTVTPAAITLHSGDDVQRLVVTGSTRTDGTGPLFDYSRKAEYHSSAPQVVTVADDGVLMPRGNGQAEVRVRFGGQTALARVTVADFGIEAIVSFRNQIEPIFTRHGCNAGGCHGKASGQNGFKLSLLGFDPAYDYAALVKEARGRRVFPAAPEQSLLVRKSIGAVAHGGGRRISPGSGEHELLVRWIRQGLPAGSAKDLQVVRIECFPKSCISERNAEQQVIVTAHYSDGTSRDVTREAQFKSNEESVAAVEPSGLVRTFELTGSTAIMARYMGQVDVC